MSSVALSGLSSVVALSRGLPPPSVFFRTFGAYLADTNIKVFTIPLSNTEVSEAEVNAFLRAAKANTQGFRGKVMKTKGMYLQGL